VGWNCGPAACTAAEVVPGDDWPGFAVVVMVRVVVVVVFEVVFVEDDVVEP